MMVLREEPICRVCQYAAASEVDHILPKEQGGDDARENLQALCKSCHSRKTVTEDGGFGGSTLVTLVTGPPGSGKSSFVKHHAKWGDLILDVDAIYAAISGLDPYDKPDCLLPFVASARDAILARLARKSHVARAWIIASMPRRIERDQARRTLRAKVIVIETAQEECVRRIAADERRRSRVALWRPIVERWWKEYERDERDRVVA